MPPEVRPRRYRTRGIVRSWARVRRNASLLLGASVLGAILLASIAASSLTPHAPDAQDLSRRLVPPVWVQGGSNSHLLGTDGFGRDILTRLLFGSRVSLLVGATSVFISGLIGIIMGLVTGYAGGWVEGVLMRFADAQQAIPPILLAIVVVSVFGANVVNLVGVLGVSSWVIYA